MKIATSFFILIFISGLAVLNSFSSTKVVVTDPTPERKVFLLRHAKSSHDDPKLVDFDRPLSAKGIEEANEIGEYLSTCGETIGFIVASPSVRTTETAKIICEKLKYDFNSIKWDSTIYACSSATLLNCIKNTGEEHRSVLFLGHNNSMTQVANILQKEDSIADMPTCAVVAIKFNDPSWKALSAGKLLFYKTPK